MQKKTLKIQVVLSSEVFLDKMNFMDFGQISDCIVPLEQLKASISLKDKLRAVMRSKKSTSQLLKNI